jgi:hypothetical protein
MSTLELKYQGKWRHFVIEDGSRWGYHL